MITKKPLIIFGGTFDPIHNGHLKIAKAVFDRFQTPITFMPTAIPNYKAAPLATNQERLEMLKIALDNNPNYIIDTFEIFQDTYTPSYKTLSYFRETLGPDSPIYYIIGEDSLISLDAWDCWQDLFKLTNFIVLSRPGYSYDMMSPKLKSVFENTSTSLNTKKTSNYIDLHEAYGKIYLLDFELSDISSTHIRNCIKSGLDITEYIPTTIIQYIVKHNIYKD